jgi:hypothetical protein
MLAYVLEDGLHESDSGFGRLNKLVFGLFDVKSGISLGLRRGFGSLPGLFLSGRLSGFQSTFISLPPGQKGDASSRSTGTIQLKPCGLDARPGLHCQSDRGGQSSLPRGKESVNNQVIL